MTRDAKFLYYNLEFTRYKEDIKKTWETINDVMNKSKIQSKFPSYFNIRVEPSPIANQSTLLVGGTNYTGKRAVLPSDYQQYNTNSRFHAAH